MRSLSVDVRNGAPGDVAASSSASRSNVSVVSKICTVPLVGPFVPNVVP
ncbi:hypothetical protein [Georgenia sp. SUBG003]